MAKKKAQKTPLIATKAAINTVLKYRQMRAEGKIGYIKEVEAVSKFVTRKGSIKKRETRYAPAREQLNEAIHKMQSAVGSKTGGEKALRKLHEQRSKERVKKASETYSNKFKSKATEQANKYLTMVEIFASESFNKLRDGGYGLGSEVTEALVYALSDKENISAQDIIEYLDQVRGTLEDVPRAAWGLAQQDDFWNAVVDLSDALVGQDRDEVTDILATYLTTDYSRENFEDALRNYNELRADEDITTKQMSFADAWEQVNQTSDPASFDNLYEIMIDEESEGET